MNLQIFSDVPLYVIAYKTKNFIQKYLKTKRPVYNKNEFKKSRVYQLTCNDCGKIHTGQTGHSLEK
jgi:translation initiation factor 2 beta subunit (eIF-2beta)/eIF-5